MKNNNLNYLDDKYGHMNAENLLSLKNELESLELKEIYREIELHNYPIENYKSLNKEVNVGSLSFRALFKNILPDEKLDTIGDRKKGLGSGKQLREHVFDVIIERDVQKEFYKRLILFMNYVYEEDLYLVLKSDYKITFYLIPNVSFRKTIFDLYEKDEKKFESVWYRWENNNLRMDWVKLIDFMQKYEHPFYKIDILLTNAINSTQMKIFEDNVKTAIISSIKQLKEL